MFWRWNVIKICVWTCVMTSRSYFGKMNSTLGSVVPLAMLLVISRKRSWWWWLTDDFHSKHLYFAKDDPEEMEAANRLSHLCAFSSLSSLCTKANKSLGPKWFVWLTWLQGFKEKGAEKEIIEKELKNETVSASDDDPNEVEEEVLSEKPIPLWATFDPNEVIFQISYLQ